MTKGQLNPKQALEKILHGVKPLGTERVPLARALGRPLEGSLKAPYDYPLRDVSAMDGFAFEFKDWKPGKSLRIAGERMAGDPAGSRLGKGLAVRIMTGAPVPPGADTVIPKEKVKVVRSGIFILEPPRKGDHVRLKAEGVRKGRKLTLLPGPLSSRSLGFLASLGVEKVSAARHPRVAALVTGEELVAPGRRPGQGGVFESNGLMLQAALKEQGLECPVEWVGDKPRSLALKAGTILRTNDILLVTGGVSVGDKDPTRKAMKQAGVKQVFWRVAQKPGGPLYFGRKGNKYVFGLPGNPASVYSCFLIYILPLLRKLQGQALPRPLRVQSGDSIEPLRTKTHFMKAKWTGAMGHRRVKVLKGQGSHLLESMALGDGLLEVPPGKGTLPRSQSLSFHPFPEAGR